MGNSIEVTRERCSLVFILILFLLPWKSYGADLTRMCYSPGTGCTDATVKQIRNAKSEVLVLAYAFTSAPIAKSLSDAHKRGVRVRVILGRSPRRNASAAILDNMKVPTFVDDKHTIADSEIMIIDQSKVITGPFSSRKDTEEKAGENVLFIKSKELAKSYIGNWSLHREHSNPYQANQTVVSTGKR